MFALTFNILDMSVRICFTKLGYWVDLVSCFLVYMLVSLFYLRYTV